LRQENKGLAIALGTSLLFVLTSIICYRRNTQAQENSNNTLPLKSTNIIVPSTEDAATTMVEGPPDLREILLGKGPDFATKYDKFWDLPDAARDVEAYQKGIRAYAYASDR
jgi:hypothetical protein